MVSVEPINSTGYRVQTSDRTYTSKNVVMATGFFQQPKLPVRDEDGFPIQTSGVTRYEGLYFVGIPWMPSEKSGFLLGVADSAQHIATHIAVAN